MRRNRPAQLLASLICAVWPHAVSAQSRAAIVSLQYESPTLVVPIAVVSLRPDPGREWTFGVVGWTLGADWRQVDRPTKRRQIYVRVTPFNANSSDYFYSQGERDDASAYTASSIEVGGGIELTHRRGWTGGYRALGLYESVSGLPPDRGGDAWQRPFVGAEMTEHYERLTAERFFGSRWDGVKVDARARVLTGTHTWSQYSLRAGVGAGRGRLHYTGRGEVFGGRNLDTVSALLVGGSWDLDFAGALVGYRYGEFRLDRGATVGGGASLRLAQAWEVGTRAAYLRTSGRSEYGAALEMTALWRGIVLNAGVALPKAGLSTGHWDHAVIFATCTAAIVRK
jgi:hypothetical protein